MSQPQDVEIYVRGKGLEKFIDGFDMGIETITLQAAGHYRIVVSEVKPAPGMITVSATMRWLSSEQAAAWEKAERWATMSKRSRNMDSINQSLALWNQLADADSVARTYLKRGSVERSTDLAAARTDMEKALELCRTIPDLRCAAESENNSGWFSGELGDIVNATQRLQEAARDWGKLHDLSNEARTRSNVGVLLWHSGDFGGAIRELEVARDVLRRNDPAGYAGVLTVIGLCYQSLAEYERAQAYFESAIAAYAHARSPRELLHARVNLARNYMLEGRLARAQLLFQRALPQAKELSDHQATAGILRNSGQTLWAQGRIDEARSQFTEALGIDQSLGDVRGQSSALHYLGLVAQKTGDAPAARDLLRQALKLRQESGLRDDVADSLAALATLEYNDGKLEAARDYAEQALKLLELLRTQVPSAALRASFYSRKRHFFDLLVDIAMTSSNSADGLLAAERGRARALMDLLAGGKLIGQLPPDLLQRRSSVQQRLDYLAFRLSRVAPERQEDLRRQIQLLAAEGEQIEAEIREAVAGQKFGQPLTSIEEIRRNLPPDSALLEFHLGTRKSYLWLVDSQQVRSFVLPPAAAIEAESSPVVRWFGRVLERQRSPVRQANFERAARDLSTTLLGALSGIPLPQRLIFAPDGVLHRVPFAALRLPKASAPIGLTHGLVQVPSAAFLTAGQRPRPLRDFPETILALVDPVFSADDPRVHGNAHMANIANPGLELARLPFTAEVSSMESLTPASRRKVLRGFDSSRDMLEKLDLEDFAVLHFSTHAVIDDRMPELSRIVLSMVDRTGRPVDGALRPDQLAQLHLNGSIVVLSACQTALGKQVLGEGLAGLTSSLLHAGGSQLVLTIAEVDAEASSEFFKEVYKRFLAGSASMEHAMTLTRREMARSRQYSDPYYWASFVVIGRPSESPVSEPAYNRR